MESVNSKLVKLSLSILSFVFFGCGGNPDKAISSNPEAPVTADEVPNNTESDLDDDGEAKISNENMRNLLEEMKQQVQNNTKIANQTAKVVAARESFRNLKETDPGFEEAYDKLVEEEGELAELVVKNTETYTVGMFSEDDQNVLMGIPRGERKTFERVEKPLEKVESIVYEPINNPKCVVAVGKNVGIHRANRADAIYLGLNVVEKTAQKCLATIEELREKLEKAIEEHPEVSDLGQRLIDRMEKVKAKIDDIEAYKGEVASKVYAAWSKEVKEQTGMNLDLENIFFSDALADTTPKDRSAFNAFVVSYVIRGTKTNHKDPMTPYSYFHGIARNKLEKTLGADAFAKTDDAVRSLYMQYCGHLVSFAGSTFTELTDADALFNELCGKKGRELSHVSLRDVHACIAHIGDFREACERARVDEKKRVSFDGVDGDSFQNWVVGGHPRTVVATASLYGYGWNKKSHDNIMKVMKKYRKQQEKSGQSAAAEDEE